MLDPIDNQKWKQIVWNTKWILQYMDDSIMQYKPKSSWLKSPTRLKGTLQQCLQQSFHHIVMTSVKSTYHNHLTNPSDTDYNHSCHKNFSNFNFSVNGYSYHLCLRKVIHICSFKGGRREKGINNVKFNPLIPCSLIQSRTVYL